MARLDPRIVKLNWKDRLRDLLERFERMPQPNGRNTETYLHERSEVREMIRQFSRDIVDMEQGRL